MALDWLVCISKVHTQGSPLLAQEIALGGATSPRSGPKYQSNNTEYKQIQPIQTLYVNIQNVL